jgi:hypothetical protein
MNSDILGEKEWLDSIIKDAEQLVNNYIKETFSNSFIKLFQYDNDKIVKELVEELLSYDFIEMREIE